MATNAPDPSDALVTVFDTEQESEAMVVKGLLETEGIDTVLTNLDAPQDILPGVGGVVIQVRPEQAEEARRIIAESRDTTQDEIEMEANAAENPEPGA